MTLLSVLRPTSLQEGTNYADHSFDADTVGAAPASWTVESGTSWTVQTAPAGLSGRAMRGVGDAAVDNYIDRLFTRVTSGELRIRWRVLTPPSTGGRSGILYLYDSSGTYAAAIGPLGGSWSLSNVSGLNTTVGSWVANTVYTVEVTVDLDQKKWKFSVGTTSYDNGGALYALTTGIAGLDRIKFSVYSPTTETFYIDDVSVGTLFPTTAPPTTTGTLSWTGTFDGVPLGSDRFGRVVLGYDNADPLIVFLKVERSLTGSTWADISAFCDVTATGTGRWTVTDKRPHYGPQATTYGGTVLYRVAGASSGGAAPSSTSTAVIAEVNVQAFENARFASMSTYMNGTAIPSSGSEAYVSNWLLGMAYAYAKTGTAQYLTDLQTEWTYIQTIEDASGILQPPDIPGHDYGRLSRDFHWRYLLHVATTARLLRRIGQGTLADAMLAKCDTWVQNFYNLNSGAPFSSITRAGWDYDNVSAGGAQLAWTATTTYQVGAIVRPTVSNGRTYRATAITTGISAGTQPTWPTTNGGTVVDGGVTWTETTQAGNVTFSEYSATAPYPGIAGADVVDLNQVMEEAAAVALLLTDPSSALFTAGALRTTALAHMLDTTDLVSAYATSTGAVPLGDVYPAANGSEGYDVLYGAYAMVLAAVCVRFAPALINPYLEAMVRRAFTGWLNVSYAAEPLQTMAFTGRVTPVFDEVATRDYAAQVVNVVNAVGPLRYTAAFNAPTVEQNTDYEVYGLGTGRGGAQMPRMFQFEVFLELLRLDSPIVVMGR